MLRLEEKINGTWRPEPKLVTMAHAAERFRDAKDRWADQEAYYARWPHAHRTMRAVPVLVAS